MHGNFRPEVSIWVVLYGAGYLSILLDSKHLTECVC